MAANFSSVTIEARKMAQYFSSVGGGKKKKRCDWWLANSATMKLYFSNEGGSKHILRWRKKLKESVTRKDWLKEVQKEYDKEVNLDHQKGKRDHERIVRWVHTTDYPFLLSFIILDD